MPRLSTALLLCAIPLAACVSEPGRVDEAAERRAANDPQALTRIADAALESGDARTASAFLGRAAKLAPADAQLQIRYARVLAEAGQTEEALKVLRQAQSRGPDDPAVSAALGRLLVSMRKPDVAAGVFRRGLAAHPNDTALLVALGVALDLAHDQAGAQAAYRRALALKPGLVAARNDLALSLALSGQAAEAIRQLNDLRADLAGRGAAPEQEATVEGNLALAYSMAGDVQKAMRTAGAALKPADQAQNARIYSALAGAPLGGGGVGGAIGKPGSGAKDVSGLPAPAGASPSSPAAAADGIAPRLPD